MSLFEKGRQKTGGRARGARNKLSQAFLEAFAADFEEHGAEVIKIVRMEKPHEYLKTAAYLMPKEFEIMDSRLTDLSDEELDVFIAKLRAQLRSPVVADVGSGEEPTLN
jgi:UTP:GlnB (protein PII) uridylyltransferase